MAARYIADVRTVQPRGPYQLTGLCFGCAVVLEMARQLRADGESVTCLVLLDGGPVTTPASYTDEEWQHEMTAWREQYLVRRAAVELGIPEAVMNALSPEARLARYLASAQRAGIVPSDVTLEQFERFLRVFGANILALTQYRPQPYDGPVTLLRTARDGADDTLGWRPFLPALTARDVPGTHLTFFRRPLVGHLATALESLMDPRPVQPDIV
jgi:thioesterase domain-containing protein